MNSELNDEQRVNLQNEASRSKTSMRLRYEAEKEVLRRQLGDLESIRSELGLSQRKICQLLMVDPSTWTRWLKDESKVPPHIYRSFQWYFELIEKKPIWHPQNSFRPMQQNFVGDSFNEDIKSLENRLSDETQLARHQNESLQNELHEIREILKRERNEFHEKLENKNSALVGWKLFVLINTLVLFSLILFG